MSIYRVKPNTPSPIISPPDLAVAWGIAVLFNVAIFSLTLYKRLAEKREIENRIFTLMIRDGTSNHIISD